MTIEQLKTNFAEVKNKLNKAAERSGRDPDEISIIAVSKTHPYEYIVNAMEAGIKVFGENYAQEFRDKHAIFDEKAMTEPEWHFIGHLQRNKVKYVAPFVKAIHSVDSLKLANEIANQAENAGREIDILLQVNTSKEDSKSGCEPGAAEELLKAIKDIKNIKIKGFMTIGSFSEDENIYRKEFRLLKSIRDEIQSKNPELDLKQLSMGMSHDYEAAIEEGSTMVRVGTAIFGNRIYNK